MTCNVDYVKKKRWLRAYLIKIRLQKMHLALLLQQPGPKMLIQLLLLNDELNIARGVVDFGARGVNLGEEFEFDGVGALLRLAVALEVEEGGLDVEFDFVLAHVRHGDGEEDVVFAVFARGAALGPCYCGGDGLVRYSYESEGAWWDAVVVLTGLLRDIPSGVMNLPCSASISFISCINALALSSSLHSVRAEESVKPYRCVVRIGRHIGGV